MGPRGPHGHLGGIRAGQGADGGTACCLAFFFLLPAVLYLFMYNKTERITASAYPHEGGSRLVIGGDNFAVVGQIAEWARALRDDPQVLASPGIPDALPSPDSPEKDAADRLRELARLKDQGLITQEEYEVKRRKLLEGL